jgi:hypothetical protein
MIQSDKVALAYHVYRFFFVFCFIQPHRADLFGALYTTKVPTRQCQPDLTGRPSQVSICDRWVAATWLPGDLYQPGIQVSVRMATHAIRKHEMTTASASFQEVKVPKTILQHKLGLKHTFLANLTPFWEKMVASPWHLEHPGILIRTHFTCHHRRATQINLLGE